MKFFSLILGLFFSTTIAAFELVDDRGVLVEFDRSPQRVISLLPSLTESVCMLDRCDRLVGVDMFSNSPRSVRPLQTLGSGLDPNIEKIIALKPDLVLVGMSPRAGEHLKALGLKVFSIEAKRYQDLQRVLEKLAVILDVPPSQPEQLWRQLNAEVTAQADALPVVKPRLKVYFEVSSVPYAAGQTSFIGEVLERLGVVNIIPSSLGDFPKINPEFVVRANPDVIMLTEKNSLALKDRPGWSGLRAVKEGRICTFTEEQSDVIVRVGPRLAEGAKAIADCLLQKGYPETIQPAVLP